MNYKEAAREIVGALEKAKWENPGAYGWPLGFDVVAAKLKELSPVPADLEAAVRGAMLPLQTHCIEKRTLLSEHEREAVKRITEAVALLLAKRDNEIEVLGVELKDWESNSYERIIADRDKRITDLLGQNQYAEDICRKGDKQIKELGEENEQQRDFINYVDDCYFLWSKKQVHVQPHFYTGWLVDRPMFVSILEEAKESPDED